MTVEGAASRVSAQNPASIAVLKKQLDAKEQQNAQILNSLPPAPPPAHLGGRVDFFA